MESTSYTKYAFLKELGIEEVNPGCYRDGEWVSGEELVQSNNPTDNTTTAQLKLGTTDNYEECINAMAAEQDKWMLTPAPLRGEIVRQIGEALREKKDALGSLISLEMGKIKSEGDGEVQEAIDVCDYACGLSRSLEGKVIPSERPGHFMMENWNPYGTVGIITAFNFPNAVLVWNAAIALVTGNTMIWKGAPSANLVTYATTKIFAEVLEKNGFKSVFTMCQGGVDIGELISSDKRVPVVSFTGSTKIGRIVSETVARRFGKSILELGGNNCTIIMDDANLDLAYKGSVFAAVGTAGQRCTSLRRMLIHEAVWEELVPKMVKAYKTVKIGDPLDTSTLMGPIHSDLSLQIYEDAIKAAKEQGGKILTGGSRIEGPGNFVEPTIIEIAHDAQIVQHESFVPIMYVIKFSSMDEAIKINNSVPQGLSSALFTNDIKKYFKWIGPTGSDCGIVNCNIGNSGAEIGGAFGGEKETGGGRESGSDSWKQYMRRSTCTVNFSTELPLAQGVEFDV